MAVAKSHIKSVLETVEDEGNPVLHVAPTKEIVPGIPPDWASVLASPEARTDVLKLWEPMARRVPKVLKEMKRSLQGVGVLTTGERPPSLIYFFTMDDKDPYFYRGYVPGGKPPKLASKLPGEFLEFYRVHDGWVDEFEFMGPMPGSDWHPLGEGPHSANFLVVLMSSGGNVIGFDLEESPTLCYFLPKGSPPKVVPKIWAEFDGWISEEMEDLITFKK